MKNPSINAFYARINKLVLLAEAYTEISDLAFIIKVCRLKPLALRDFSITLRKQWIDEYGNSLNIIKGKRIHIIENDLSIDRDKLVCTDMYHNLSLSKIAKMSKLAYICCGYDDEPYYMISFLGIDNYLRTYLYYDFQWQQVSSLILGMRVLKFIAHNQDVRFFINSTKKEKLPVPCSKGEEWLSLLPASQLLLTTLEKRYGTVFSFLTGE